MWTAYANRDSVSTRLKQNVTQTITKHTRVCERKAHIVCEERYISLNLKGAFEMRHSFLYFFSLARTSEFLCANFSSTCVRFTRHLLKRQRARAGIIRSTKFPFLTTHSFFNNGSGSLPHRKNYTLGSRGFSLSESWGRNHGRRGTGGEAESRRRTTNTKQYMRLDRPFI